MKKTNISLIAIRRNGREVANIAEASAAPDSYNTSAYRYLQDGLAPSGVVIVCCPPKVLEDGSKQFSTIVKISFTFNVLRNMSTGMGETPTLQIVGVLFKWKVSIIEDISLIEIGIL